MHTSASASPPDPNARFVRALARPGGAAALARARRVLVGVGVDVANAENPDSASNDVWLAGDCCLRMSREPGESGLFTEAALAALLPAEVGYPRVLATGSEDGHEWVLSERLPGHNLWDGWPILTPEQRLDAVADLWRRHLALQQTDPARLIALGLPPHPRYRFDRHEAVQQLRLLVVAGVLEQQLASPLWASIERGLAAVRLVPWRLVHGDPAFSNAQCCDGGVIGLLDLETACVAPCDADLQPLLRMLADPVDDPSEPGPFGLPTRDSFEGAFERLMAVAAPLLALPGAESRLRCYSVLFELTILANALRRGIAAPTLRGWAGRLRPVVSGASYLDRVWPGKMR